MNDADFMRDVLQRIATGPTLSKDITRDDSRRAMQIILDGDADEVQAGIFLIALRMKRETNEELAGILDAINQGIQPTPLAVDHLITIVDPYDGYLRSTPVAPFLPAVLAACGLSVITHGVESMGPKFGASHESVLRAAGYPIIHEIGSVVSRLENPACGWAYVPQGVLAPKLAALQGLRTRIVKRPCLTTLEVAIRAFKPRVASHLVTGYVHKPYPPIYAFIAKVAGFATSMSVRGVEGSIVPSLSQSSRYFLCDADLASLAQIDIAPESLGIDSNERAIPLPASLRSDEVRSVKAPGNPFAGKLSVHASELGLAALRGEPGYARDTLVYAGACVLHARDLASTLKAAATQVSRVLDSGAALERFNSAL